ncbi:MAG TPA: tetratricopeptide repeat protein [Candidatus Acidoferrales bacterium]|nr:tetratricopeptide repeat protein [Candidatus Acidoferrales bacterium]
MGYSKIKHVEAAQKHLAQGRVPQAITEYQNILKHEPSDQVTLMTVGDLYVRSGETFQAIEYFQRLAQIFVRDGFLTKAIAIYKKIAKLAPEETAPLEKLADLYVQQGVLSEARPLFLQLAEAHIKAGRREPAALLLRKLLEAEPDNLRVQLRLAEVQLAMGQKQDAAQTFLICAERQLSHHDPEEAVKLIGRSLELVPGSVPARMLQARALAAAGKHGQAAAILEAMPDLDSGNEAAELLLDNYLQEGLSDRALKLVAKVLARDPAHYAMAGKTAMALLESGHSDDALGLLDTIRKTMADKGDAEPLAQMLHTAALRLSGRIEPLDWLVQLYTQINDAFHLPEALAQFAQAAAAAGHFDRARLVYEQLAERSPEDLTIRRNLEHVRARLGLEPMAPAGEAQGPVVDEPTPPKVFEEPALDDDTQQYVNLALTDVDLFSSYGLTPKAIELLERVVERAPRHTPSLEKLLDLHLGEGNNDRTAQLAGLLMAIHAERGDTANSERFAELHRRFQRAAALDPQSPPTVPASTNPPAEFALPAPGTVAEASLKPPLAGEAVEEVAENAEPAIADEWASISEQVLEAEARSKLEESSEPEHATIEANQSAFEGSEDPGVPALRSVMASGSQSGAAQEEEIIEYELELVEEMAQPAASATVSPIRPAAQQDGGTLGDLATELGMVLDAAPPVAHSAPGNGKPSSFVPPAHPAKTAYPQPSTPLVAASDPGGPLSEIFNEFREALDELQTDEDPETHYNLGIAYREMGLLEEAISEFQKVVHSHDTGKVFRYSMQCCTLLALAFMDKGQPEIASFWYKRALQTPDLDQESILALRYDLGVAQDLSGHSEEAIKSFQQVYAMNIDYRDVAERIGSLRQR